MSLSRAFTTRRVKESIRLAEESISRNKDVQRSNTTKPKGSVGVLRHKISAPVELVHTTNMLSYNAPDLFPKGASSTSSSSAKSDDESDGMLTSASSPPTSPDVASSDERSMSPEPNHLSCYFTAPGSSTAPMSSKTAPAIPQRAPSHTKKSYDAITRQRSVSRMSEQSTHSASTKASFSLSRASSTSTNTSVTTHSSASNPPVSHMPKMSNASSAGVVSAVPPVPSAAPALGQPLFSPLPRNMSPPTSMQHRKDFSASQHPFGHELAQVSEIAEEYGVRERLNTIDEEEAELKAAGLFKFSANDYLSEIQGLFVSFLHTTDAPRPQAALWI